MIGSNLFRTAIKSHSLFVSSTSHSLFVSSTSHSLFVSSTSHSLFVSSTSHSLSLFVSSTSHSQHSQLIIWTRIVAAPEPASLFFLSQFSSFKLWILSQLREVIRISNVMKNQWTVLRFYYSGQKAGKALRGIVIWEELAANSHCNHHHDVQILNVSIRLNMDEPSSN